MRRITSKNTKPEILVRQLVHGLGYRYRLHVKALPGRPDVVFRPRKKAIFVHGCFWHQHSECREGRMPGSRQEYWIPKLTRNIERDQDHIQELTRLGWKTLVLWECQTSDLPKLTKKIKAFLGKV